MPKTSPNKTQYGVTASTLQYMPNSMIIEMLKDIVEHQFCGHDIIKYMYVLIIFNIIIIAMMVTMMMMISMPFDSDALMKQCFALQDTFLLVFCIKSSSGVRCGHF